MERVGRVSVFLLCVALTLFIFSFCVTSVNAGTKTDRPQWMDSSVAKLKGELASKFGEAQREREERGLNQVAQF